MADGKVRKAYARTGDAPRPAWLSYATVSTLEVLLGDAATLLDVPRLVVVRGDQQLVAVGPCDEELRDALRRVIKTRAPQECTAGWLITRHAVPGLADLSLLTVHHSDAVITERDDAVVRLLTRSIALAARVKARHFRGAGTDAPVPGDVGEARRSELLELLLGIQRRISHRAPLEEVFEAVVGSVSLLMNNDASAIALVDPSDPDWLEPVALANVAVELLPGLARARVTEGVAGRAFSEQRLVVFDDYAKSEGSVDAAADAGVRAAMAAPVSTAGRVMGAIVVLTADADRRYTTEDRTMLLALAENVSLALTDAHNLQRVDEALHDSITGLPTRTVLLHRLTRVLDGRRSDVGILFCDLDRFKRVNDSLGHAAGDELLLEVARRLSSVLRPTDTAARLGGDEFAVLLEDVDEHSARAIAARIIAAFSEAFTVRGHSMRIGISIGLALAPAGQESDGEHLLSAADIAMYHAKRAGGSRLRCFEPAMAATAVEELALETDLQRALHAGEFHVVYQPVFDLWAGHVAGLETLLRWTNPRRGPVPPDTFIPIAEDSGLITDIDAWVIDTACATLRAWQQPAGRDDLDLGVNLSARQFADPELVPTIDRALSASGLDPGRFVIEITERVVIGDAQTAVKRLRDVRGLGVRVALDDFGTGYSSLSHLRQLPIDFLKIDRAFLPDTDNDRDWALTNSIIRIASDLGMVAIAEGIETERQLARLRQMGCPSGQGFLLAHPVAGDQLGAAVDQRLPCAVPSPR
jgi:diguanylate cyclase (GGDEF)-like protein